MTPQPVILPFAPSPVTVRRSAVVNGKPCDLLVVLAPAEPGEPAIPAGMAVRCVRIASASPVRVAAGPQ